MDVKPIPAFYCCYLLRSTIRHSSLYVGSTPNPTRRLAQHNGSTKGGAVRTSRGTLRPWEMTCLVQGFPSNIAALQFEWAWHNPHLTRHIASDQRISMPVKRTKTFRSGKSRTVNKRPPHSLTSLLSNLHLLLRAPYFSKWPLEVRFFTEDVFRRWQTWCGRVDQDLPGDLNVCLDLPQRSTEVDEFTSAQPPPKRKKADMIGRGGVEGIDPTYARFQDVLGKGQFLLDSDDGQKCDVCQQPVDVERQLFAICPLNDCNSLSHITCLSRRFVEQTHASSMVPHHGDCPNCRMTLGWSDLMTELSLRSRGQKEVQKLLSKKRKTKAATAAELLDSESNEDAEASADEQPFVASSDQESDTEQTSVPGDDPLQIHKSMKASALDKIEIVIQDSEDEC